MAGASYNFGLVASITSGGHSGPLSSIVVVSVGDSVDSFSRRNSVSVFGEVALGTSLMVPCCDWPSSRLDGVVLELDTTALCL